LNFRQAGSPGAECEIDARAACIPSAVGPAVLVGQILQQFCRHWASRLAVKRLSAAWRRPDGWRELSGGGGSFVAAQIAQFGLDMLSLAFHSEYEVGQCGDLFAKIVLPPLGMLDSAKVHRDVVST